MRYLLSIAIIVFCAGCGEKKKPADKPDANSKPATNHARRLGQVHLPAPFALKRSIENDLRRQNKKAQQRKAIFRDLTNRK